MSEYFRAKDSGNDKTSDFSILNGKDQLFLSRMITKLHDNPEVAYHIFAGERLSGISPRAHVVGITGSGGGGKSTLINGVVRHLAEDGNTVVVLSIDPTSTQNGGALLGDRIRMKDLSLHENVFIRSLAARGAQSGLTVALPQIIAVSSLFADYVVVETAGSGQGDVSVHELVDTLTVLLVPVGDFVTHMKSGQLDHAHIIVINDREDIVRAKVEQCAYEVKQRYGRQSVAGWQTKIFKVNALDVDSASDLVKKGLYEHKKFLSS